MYKEKSVTIKIIKVFSNEKIFPQHSVSNFKLICVFPSTN